MPTLPLQPFSYLFPERISLYVDFAAAEVTQWLDAATSFLSTPALTKYKNANFAYAAARSCPDAVSYKHLRACTRSTLLLKVFAGHYAIQGITQCRAAGKQLTDILEGAAPNSPDNWLFHQAAANRNEIQSFMPGEWYPLFLKALKTSLAAVVEEVPYIISNQFPSLKDFMAIREHFSAGEFYSKLIEMQLGVALPAAVALHPHMLRMSILLSRLITWQQDLYSFLQEIGADTAIMNIIPVLQQEHNISLQEACQEARRIHDTDLEEFIGLQRDLPDFGIHQQFAENYVQHMGVELQGYNSFYLKDILRYTPGGYAEPEFSPAN